MNLPEIIKKRGISRDLTKLLETPERAVYSTDDNPGGFDILKGTWEPPISASQCRKLEAGKLLADLEAQQEPATDNDKRAWLVSLGVLQGKKTDNDMAEVKVTAYARVLRHSASCFTDETLDAAMREFSPWFPDCGSLAIFLDQFDCKAMVDRLHMIIGAPLYIEPPKPSEETPEEKAAGLRTIYANAYTNAGMKVPGGELSNEQFQVDLDAHLAAEAAHDAKTLEARKAEFLDKVREG